MSAILHHVRYASTNSDTSAPVQPQSQPAQSTQPSLATSSAAPLSAAPSSSASAPASTQSFWQYWTSEPVSHPRYSALWWRDTVLILVVFSITGSLSLLVVRPLLSSVFGITGSLRDGPNSYRLLSVMLVPPAYSVMLVTIGTLAGQHVYFKRIALRMWGRLLPKSWVGGSKRPADKLR